MNGRNILILFVVGGAAFALLMLWWARAVGFPRHAPSSAPPVATTPASSAAAPAPSAQASLAPGTTAATASSPSGTTAAASNSQPETIEQKQARMLQTVLEIKQRNSRRYARALALWDSEKRDAAWAGPRENALRLALEHDSIEVTPDQLECRATLCRLRLHPPNPLAHASAVSSEMGNTYAIGSEDSGPEHMLLLFIARAGQNLDG
jgi:hypothetical protein